MTIREENKADFPEIAALRDGSSLTPFPGSKLPGYFHSVPPGHTEVGTPPIHTRADTPTRPNAQTPTRSTVPFSVNIHPTCGMKISDREPSF